MEERKLNEKESLELITRMIRNTQQNIEVGSGNQFIVWGVSILIASILVTILTTISGNPFYNFAWFLIPVMGYTWTRVLVKEEKVFTHIDKLLGQTWAIVGVLCVSIPLIIGLLNYFAGAYVMMSGSALYSFIPMIEIIIVSLGLAVSGIAINSKYIKIASFIGLGISFLTLLYVPHIIALSYAAFAITCFIIPGIKLNHEIKKMK